MTEKPEKPFSLAMQSALQAVARMKGDSGIAWSDFMAEDAPDDRHAPTTHPARNRDGSPQDVGANVLPTRKGRGHSDG